MNRGLEHGEPSAAGRYLGFALWSTLALVAACGSAIDAADPSTRPTDGGVSGSGGGGGSGGSGGGSTGSDTAGEGLPCDVAAVLKNTCLACHGSPLVAGAPMNLLSYADLTGQDKSEPGKTVAQVCLERMQSATKPMPPAGTPGPSAAEIATFAAWVNGGAPMGTCDTADAGPDPFAGPPTCTSGKTWVPPAIGDGGSATMRPGETCLKSGCHTNGEKIFSLGGTAYATGHEPNDCYGAPLPGEPSLSTATVEITDHNGVVITRKLNSVGNFYYQGSIAKPYTARVVYNGKERKMVTPQTSGDCNSCHTESGAKMAPGRILLP